MSTIKSSAENLTLNADGANNDIKFQSNGSEVAQIDQAGVISSTGGTTHADNVKAKFGTGNDLEVYHDGTHNRLQCPTGELKLRASAVRLGSVAGENGINMVGDGAVELYHNNAKKIETTATGVTVTGKVGIGTTTPQTEMHVVTANTSLVHIGGTANANGDYQGISLGYSEAGNTAYRKVAVVSAGLNDGAGRQAFHVLVDTAADSGSVQLADSKFSVNGTTGICQARNGLTFGTDTATANTLDDYEEGTWTPAISGTTGSFNISGTSNYTKIGNLVTVNSYIYNGTNIGNTAAEWDFTGLPYTPIRDAICAVRFHNVNIPSDVKYCVISIQTGSSGIEVWGVRDAASMDVLQWSDIGGGHVEFTCTYCSTS